MGRLPLPDKITAIARERLFIRYKNPRLRSKERKIELDHGWLSIMDEYIAQYKPSDTLFTCTARNLEYILHDIADNAGLKKGTLSFENLREVLSKVVDW